MSESTSEPSGPSESTSEPSGPSESTSEPSGPGGWRELPDGAGTVLAVAGEVRVAAEPGRLRIWRGLDGPAVVAVPTSNPARPRILPGRLRWGPFAVALDGEPTSLPWAGAPDGYVQTAHAWSADGAAAVVVGRRIDRSGSGPEVAAWRCAPPGRTLVWTGSGVPPTAVAWAGDDVVLGTRDPVVLGPDGSVRHTLRGPTPPLRIDAAAGRVLLVGSGRLSVWDGPDLVGDRTGLWLDAGLTPDSAAVLAVTGDGALLRLGPDLRDQEVLAADPRATAVATDGEWVVAAFPGPSPLQVTRMV